MNACPESIKGYLSLINRRFGQVTSELRDQVKDEFIGKRGSAKRDKYEQELQMELLGVMIQ